MFRVLPDMSRGVRIYVYNPHLPGFLQPLRMENIKAGNASAALEFTSRQDKIYCRRYWVKGDVL